MNDAIPAPGQVQDAIAAVQGASPLRWLRRLALLLALASIVVGVVLWRWQERNQGGASYVAVAVRRGDLGATVTATGKLEPLDRVEVGAEVSGRVTKVHVDFNDRVERGQVLCELDAEQFRAARNQARAQLRVAEAELSTREASRAEAETVAVRARALEQSGLSTRAELDAAEAALTRAQAAIAASRAQIAFSRAALDLAETSLKKAQIVSPIDGVVLSRNVEPGQTLAATFAAPTLFTLARDLGRMELHIGIDEADIGRATEGQPATFVVDAHPNRVFPAELTSIHNVATTLDNVVTYEAVLLVDNADAVLRPGMTATATIVTAERKNALLVPNSALRFTPPSLLERGSGGPPNPFARGARREATTARAALPAGRAEVWLDTGAEPRLLTIETGLTDGEWTEVLAGELSEDSRLVVDVITRED